MSDPRPRVFISSVMDGYAQFRDAAAEGIRQAGCEPVRAEDFPAAGRSPRNACLDGVRSADALVLLLGQRHGFLAPSGKAVTEEEYEEARHSHKRILVFLEDVPDREPAQEEFVERVQGFVDGHWRKSFRDPGELTKLVLEAVTEADLVAAPNLENRAGERLGAAVSRRPPESQGIVWLETAWTTLRDEEVVDPVDLGDAGFQRQIQRLAHECDPPLFSYEQPKRTEVSTSSLTITQGDPAGWREARDLVTLEIRFDGTLSIAQNVSGTEARTGAMDGVFEMYFLDPTIVRGRLERAWALAAAWWDHRDPFKRHDPLLFNLVLHDVGRRRWGEPPRSPGSGISIPGECPRNPLFVYDRPRKVSRSDLTVPGDEIDRSLTMMERAFQEWENKW